MIDDSAITTTDGVPMRLAKRPANRLPTKPAAPLSDSSNVSVVAVTCNVSPYAITRYENSVNCALAWTAVTETTRSSVGWGEQGRQAAASIGLDEEACGQSPADQHGADRGQRADRRQRGPPAEVRGDPRAGRHAEDRGDRPAEEHEGHRPRAALGGDEEARGRGGLRREQRARERRRDADREQRPVAGRGGRGDVADGEQRERGRQHGPTIEAAGQRAEQRARQADAEREQARDEPDRRRRLVQVAGDRVEHPDEAERAGADDDVAERERPQRESILRMDRGSGGSHASGRGTSSTEVDDRPRVYCPGCREGRVCIRGRR